MSHWVIACDVQELLQLKVSVCTVWQVNVCCSFVNTTFHICSKLWERVRMKTTIFSFQRFFLLDVTSQCRSRIQLFLVVWYLCWHFKVLEILKPQINENLKKAIMFAKGSEHFQGALGNLLSWERRPGKASRRDWDSVVGILVPELESLSWFQNVLNTLKVASHFRRDFVPALCPIKKINNNKAD